jgi:hypothetical protein
MHAVIISAHVYTLAGRNSENCLISFHFDRRGLRALPIFHRLVTDNVIRECLLLSLFPFLVNETNRLAVLLYTWLASSRVVTYERR